MKKYIRKFRLLALSGAIVSIGAVTSITAACGSTTTNGEGDEAEIVKFDFMEFKEEIMKSIVFEGDAGSGRVVDNAILDIEIPNVTLKYGWTTTKNVQPSGTVTDYKQIQDLTNGYFFTIDMEAINGATFEGEAPATIYKEITELTTPIELMALSESTKIISENDVNSFITAATLGILFDGDDGSVYPMENSILNKGISNVTLKYGWTETKNAAPSATVNDYHLLTDMKNGYFFTIDFVANENITFEGPMPPTLFIEVNTENNLNLAFAFIMNEYYNYYLSFENQTPYVFNADGVNIDDILGPLEDIYLNFLIDNIAVTVNNVGSLLLSLLDEFVSKQFESFLPLFNELMAENAKFDGMWEGLILLGGWAVVAGMPGFNKP